MARHVFTIIAKIAPQHEQALRNELAAVAAQPKFNEVIDFSQFSDLHFASFVIFDDLLVFENSVSGSRNAYLRALADYAHLDRVYRYCTDFGQYEGELKTADERYRYLRDHYRKPNLRHVSTTYRTVSGINEDRAVVEQLQPFATLPPHSSLLRAGARAPAIRENWHWEVIKPYLALAGLVALLAWTAYVWWHVRSDSLVPWLGYLGWHPRRWPWLNVQKVVLLLDMALAWIGGVPLLISMWRTTPAPLRARAWWATGRTLFVLVLSLVAWSLGAAHWIGALLLLGVAALVVVSLVNTALRWSSEDLISLRQAMSPEDALWCWNRLREARAAIAPARYQPERSCWWQKVWNWRYWILGPTLTTLAVGALQRNDLHVWMYWGALAVFAIEAWWVTILVGWRPYALSGAARTSLLAKAMFFAWLVVTTLAVFDPPRVFYAVALLGVWLALQAWTLAAPDVEVSPPTTNEQDRINEVMTQEDCGVQNHMALAAYVGTSWTRKISLRVFLWTLDRIFYRALLPDVYRGRLFGIPTVHSAQWVLLPDGRYLFLSNYDHSFTTYLNDFGTQIPSGIQKIWGICEGNPGMADVERFKLFVRKAMVPHQVWYRAYEDISVRQIWNNERIRIGLAVDDIDEPRMIATLRRFGAAPKIVPGITHAAQ